MENQNNHTITLKECDVGQTHIKVIIRKLPTENQIKRTLTKIYDVINDIAHNAEKRGVDTSKWFYTDKQVAELKKDPKNRFL